MKKTSSTKTPSTKSQNNTNTNTNKPSSSSNPNTKPTNNLPTPITTSTNTTTSRPKQPENAKRERSRSPRKQPSSSSSSSSSSQQQQQQQQRQQQSPQRTQQQTPQQQQQKQQQPQQNDIQKLLHKRISQLEIEENYEKEDAQAFAEEMDKLKQSTNESTSELEALRTKHMDLFKLSKQLERDMLKLRKKNDAIIKEKEVVKQDYRKAMTQKQQLEKLCRELTAQKRASASASKETDKPKEKVEQQQQQQGNSTSQPIPPQNSEETQAVIADLQQQLHVMWIVKKTMDGENKRFRASYRDLYEQYATREQHYLQQLNTKTLECEKLEYKLNEQIKKNKAQSELIKDLQSTTQNTTFQTHLETLRKELSLKDTQLTKTATILTTVSSELEKNLTTITHYQSQKQLHDQRTKQYETKISELQTTMAGMKSLERGFHKLVQSELGAFKKSLLDDIEKRKSAQLREMARLNDLIRGLTSQVRDIEAQNKMNENFMQFVQERDCKDVGEEKAVVNGRKRKMVTVRPNEEESEDVIPPPPRSFVLDDVDNENENDEQVEEAYEIEEEEEVEEEISDEEEHTEHVEDDEEVEGEEEGDYEDYEDYEDELDPSLPMWKEIARDFIMGNGTLSDESRKHLRDSFEQFTKQIGEKMDELHINRNQALQTDNGNGVPTQMQMQNVVNRKGKGKNEQVIEFALDLPAPPVFNKNGNLVKNQGGGGGSSTSSSTSAVNNGDASNTGNSSNTPSGQKTKRIAAAAKVVGGSRKKKGGRGKK